MTKLHLKAPVFSNNWVTLPQNLMVSAGSLYEGFETTGDWSLSPGGVGSLAANVTQVFQGTQSMKITSPVGATVGMHKTISRVFSDIEHFEIYLYLHDPTADYQAINIELAALTNYTKKMNFNIGASTTWLKQGQWMKITIPKAYFTASGGCTWADTMIRFRVQAVAKATKTVNVSADSLTIGQVRLPAVSVRFDDGYINTYTVAYPIMEPHKIRGTIYAITDWIDGIGLSSAQLLDLDAHGWSIANHTDDHTDLTTLSEADQELRIDAGRDALDALGLTRASRYMCLPLGLKNADTYTALAAQGMLTCTNGGTARLPVLPAFDIYEVESQGISNTTSLATAQGYVDTAITNKSILNLVFHSIVETPTIATEWATADFQSLMNYIASKRSQISCITIDDYYNLTLGAVRVQKAR